MSRLTSRVNPVADPRPVSAGLTGLSLACPVYAAKDLTQEFGLARTTAAKALRLLADEGLAEVSEGLGYFVRKD